MSDIAIIKLEEKIDFTNSSIIEKTDCVPRWNQRDSFKSNHCIAMGWGRDEYDNKPRILQEVMLPMLDARTCARFDSDHDWDVCFCAGYVKEIKQTFVGDSGGPLICPVEINGGNDYKFVLIGVISFGYRKCPGFFTRVSYFENWINQTIDSD